MKKKIWTIGHSTKSLEVFIQLLKSFDIKVLADVRRFPGSRKFPHFNKAELEISLKDEGIAYIHFEDLGGRREPLADSTNQGWRHQAFRGYADYMATENFNKAIKELMEVADDTPAAIMCSEALWWRCHRSLIADFLKSKGWVVVHIMGIGKTKEHPFSSVARIIQGRLDYSKE